MQANSTVNHTRHGISLLELLAAISIIGVLAAAIVPRLGRGSSLAKSEACAVQREVIQIQARLWRREHGRWPRPNLRDVGADKDFFPEGLPTCPVDGSTYRINRKTGLVLGHDH